MLETLGEPKFRAGQLFKWLQSGITSFDEMSNIPKSLRNTLSEISYLARADIYKRYVSKIDSTVKYVLKLYDGELIETVLMKYEHGYSICVSSQVGCRMGCKFCASGLNGLSRSLTASEIIAQILTAQKDNKRCYDGNGRAA